jgi:hypothetical protein
MIPEIEKNIYVRIKFTDNYLSITSKFIKDGEHTPIFKKNEILNVFNDLGRPIRYIAGGAYVYRKSYENFDFELSSIITKNSPNLYIYIYKDGKLLDNRTTNIGSLLRYIPYNVELAESINTKGFGLNSLEHLKFYLREMLLLFDAFVAEYIKEIEAGNSPG